MFEELNELDESSLKQITQYSNYNHSMYVSSLRTVMRQQPELTLLVAHNVNVDDLFNYAPSNMAHSVILEINNNAIFEDMQNAGIQISFIANMTEDAVKNKHKFICLLYATKPITEFNVFIHQKLIFLKLKCIDYYEFPQGHIKIVYSDIKRTKEKKKHLLYFNGGIGDLFTLIPVFYYCKTNNIETPTLCFSDNKFIQISQRFGLNNIKLIDYKELGLSFVVFNYRYKLFDNLSHIMLHHETKKSFFETHCDYYINSVSKANIPYKSIFSNFKKDSLFQWKNKGHNNIRKVAVQRLSSSKDGNRNLIKEWPKYEMRKFIKYCLDNNIELINICPHDCMRAEYHYDEGHRDILNSLELLCDVDLFIGIDSCFGHACSLLGTPSISLFISNDVFLRYVGHKHMPLSMNHSIFSPSNYITSEKVVQVMQDVFSGKITLSEEYIPLKERLEREHYSICKNTATTNMKRKKQ